MAKILGPKDNFRVVIEPRSPLNFGIASISRGAFGLYGRDAEGQKRFEDEYQRRCDEIVADIKRHVDNVGHVTAEFDQQDVCEFCGSQWTEEGSAYNGGCCSRDDEVAPAEQVQA